MSNQQIDIEHLTIEQLKQMSALTVVPGAGEKYADYTVNQDDANEAAVANMLDRETYNPLRHGGMSFDEYARSTLLGVMGGAPGIINLRTNNDGTLVYIETFNPSAENLPIIKAFMTANLGKSVIFYGEDHKKQAATYMNTQPEWGGSGEVA